MAVKSSGQLSLRYDIAAEVNGATSNISLRAMSSIAGFRAPDAMSEFYGYSASIFQYVSGQSLIAPRGSGTGASPLEITMSSFGDGNSSSAIYRFTGRNYSGPIQLTVNTTDQDTTVIFDHRGRRLSVGRFQGPENIGNFSLRTNDEVRITLDIQRGDEDFQYLRAITIALLEY